MLTYGLVTCIVPNLSRLHHDRIVTHSSFSAFNGSSAERFHAVAPVVANFTADTVSVIPTRAGWTEFIAAVVVFSCR
jgi:hypothetical protein